MCTVITFRNKGLYAGRNMDIDFDFGQQIAVMPREFCLTTKQAGTLVKHYAMIGAARCEDGYPLYAEACNECGLFMAGLNFPENAVYADKATEGKTGITPYELIPYVLGKCRNVDEAKNLLANADIIAVPFKPSLPLAPLHWILADGKESAVLERTAEGIRIFDDPFGVLTNNPGFEFHSENVKQYIHLSVKNTEKSSARVGYGNFSEGAGAIGLPGDFSSASRFVKAWFCLENSKCGECTDECVAQVFHILDSVAMVRGTVVTQNERQDVTAYSCCIDAESGTYFYKTYDSLGAGAVRMTEKNKAGSELSVFDFRTWVAENVAE